MRFKTLSARTFRELASQIAGLANARSLIIDSVTIIILLAIFVSLYLQVLDIHVWRHDELLMFSDYTGKLRGEGRWLNHILFPFLRRTPPQVSIFLCLACWSYFSYRVARRYTEDRRLQIIYTLVALQLPAFYSIIGWPCTVLPAFVLLAVSALLAERLDFRGVFLLSGLLFFGTFNNFYNLILLLYIREISQSDTKKLLRIFFWWTGSYLAGYLLMLILTKLIGGHWGLLIASWRRPHKIHCLNDLYLNLCTVWHSLKQNVELVGRNASLVLLALCLFLGGIACLNKDKTGKRTLIAIGAVITVLLAGYAQSVPFGLFVVARTAVGLYAAVFTLMLILCCRSRNLGLVILLWIALFTSYKNADSIGYYTGVTNTWRDSIISMNVPPAATNVVHICSPTGIVAASERMIMRNQGLTNHHQEGFGVNWRQFSILRSIGYRHYDTNVGICDKYADRPRNETMIHSWLYADKQLFVWYK